MIGTANNRAAAGSTNRTVITSSARLVFVSETTSPIISMRGIRACCGAPSAREIAAVTAKTPTMFSAEVARKAVGQSRGPKLAVTPTSNWTTPTVTTEHRRNWARLKASLTDR